MASDNKVRLIGRSSSHFTRVAAMFAHELDVPFELVVIHDLASTDASAFGGNPALKIPTLQIDGALLFGAENICRRLVELAGRRGDPRIVLAESTTSDEVRSAQELVWHAMSAQVQLVVGTVFAKLPSDNVFFVKSRAGLLGALRWLDAHVVSVQAALPAERTVSLFEVTLFCLVEHLAFRPTVPLDDYPALRAFTTTFAARPSAQRTIFRLDPPA